MAIDDLTQKFMFVRNLKTGEDQFKIVYDEYDLREIVGDQDSVFLYSFKCIRIDEVLERLVEGYRGERP